jgi:hypothetical protein
MRLAEESKYRRIVAGGPPSAKGPGSGHYERQAKKLAAPVQLDPEASTGLHTFLNLLAQHSLQSSFIKNNGKEYSESIPAQKMGRVKQCYMNAYRLADRDPSLTYVEGVAMNASVPFPLEHAWVVNQQGQVIDPTWSDGKAYFGVPFSNDYMHKVALRSGVYGIISHTNKPLLQGKDEDWKAD